MAEVQIAIFFASVVLGIFNRIKRKAVKGRVQLANMNDSTSFDILVVGAGPAGSTAAYFLATKYNLKVGLFDKKRFPRQKICGDAWCAPALKILEEMKVLEKMESDGIVHSVTRGGFISPFGYQCINSEGATYGSVTGCKTYAIKRQIADKYLVDAATESVYCTFIEAEVSDAKLVSTSSIDGLNPDSADEHHWEVTAVQPGNISEGGGQLSYDASYRAKVLLICDGSTSYLGQKLGLVKAGSYSEAECSHSYVKGGSHQWTDADGVMVFTKSLLPGYSALFRHFDGDMYLGTYLLPPTRATSACIKPVEFELIESHPYIRQAFGATYEWNQKQVVAPIRLGGIYRSYGKQVLLVGDAAGQVDPLTGEGIHLAMTAAKIAADCVGEMFSTSDFSEWAGWTYWWRCWRTFGWDLLLSQQAAYLIARQPMLLDAVAVVGQRRGQAFLDFFGEVMTGVRPKSDFLLRPKLLLDIVVEYLHQFVIQYLLRRPPLAPADIGEAVVARKEAAKKNRTLR